MEINPITSFAKSSTARKYMDWTAKEKRILVNGVETKVSNYARLQKYYPKFFMTWIALTQIYFLIKSKEMEKERKLPLMLNILMSCAIALATGAVCGKHINNLTNKMIERANVVYKNNSQKSNLIDGIKTGMPFLTEAILFEYLGPVIATPLSIHAASYLSKKGLINLKEKPKSDSGVDNYKVS